MKNIFIYSVLLASLAACTPHGEPVKFSTSSEDKTEFKHPSKRMGFSDMPQRMPLMREKYYGPEGGCTVGRQTKGWC